MLEYVSPLSERYASSEMQSIFSYINKFRIWRRLWIVLAESEMELGLPLTKSQVDELKSHEFDVNIDVARKREKITKHDVMAHVYAYGQQCPTASGIIHLGATSCYVTDNADIIIYKDALNLTHKKLVDIIKILSNMCRHYRYTPTLGYTHLQPAQPTTVGKRMCMWLADMCTDLQDIEYIMQDIKLLGSKGATGTQASFLELFNGDTSKVRELDNKIAKKLGFDKCYTISGQTYSRKLDSRIGNVLAGVAQTMYKMSNDIRLLQHMGEVEEPFGEGQIGSSAMAYKRNPMKCERIASLSRYVIINSLNPAMNMASQWLERTLDDSANKRLSMAELFLTLDGILDIAMDVLDGLNVYNVIINKHLNEKLPFMATENIIMDMVKSGGDRQEIHEKIRQISMQAIQDMRDGKDVDMMERLSAEFNLSDDILNPQNYIGLAGQQVERFLEETVKPILIREYKNDDIKDSTKLSGGTLW